MLSNSTRKLLWFEITKMLFAVLKNKLTLLFTIIFGTLSFPVGKLSTLRNGPVFCPPCVTELSIGPLCDPIQPNPSADGTNPIQPTARGKFWTQPNPTQYN